MKRGLWILIVFACLLIGCGDESDTTEDSTDESTAEETAEDDKNGTDDTFAEEETAVDSASTSDTDSGSSAAVEPSLVFSSPTVDVTIDTSLSITLTFSNTSDSGTYGLYYSQSSGATSGGTEIVSGVVVAPQARLGILQACRMAATTSTQL